jgi:hypothetical protein
VAERPQAVAAHRQIRRHPALQRLGLGRRAAATSPAPVPSAGGIPTTAQGLQLAALASQYKPDLALELAPDFESDSSRAYPAVTISAAAEGVGARRSAA